MIYVLYAIWILLPLSFFLMALWGALESRSKKTKRTDLRDVFNQGLFLSVAVAIAFIVDLYLLDSIVEGFLPDLLPKGLAQVLLLPLILFIAGAAVGGSKGILISRPPGGRKPPPKRRR